MYAILKDKQNDNAAGRLTITCCACEFRLLLGTLSDGGHATRQTSHLTQGALFLFAFFPSDLRAIRQDTYKGGILIKLRRTNWIARTQKHKSCCGTCSTGWGCRGWAGVSLPVHVPNEHHQALQTAGWNVYVCCTRNRMLVYRQRQTTMETRRVLRHECLKITLAENLRTFEQVSNCLFIPKCQSEI